MDPTTEPNSQTPTIWIRFIMKTYNFDSLKPHFYMVKLGFTWVYIIFLLSTQKHRLWVLVRTASHGAVRTSTHNPCFKQKYEKYQSFLSENFQFLVEKFSIYLNRRVFVMWGGNHQPTRRRASQRKVKLSTIIGLINAYEVCVIISIL